MPRYLIGSLFRIQIRMRHVRSGGVTGRPPVLDHIDLA